LNLKCDFLVFTKFAFLPKFNVYRYAELTDAKLREDLERAQVRGLEVSREILEQGLHSSVEGDVKEMLQGWALYTLDSEGLTHSA
jgi:hypothetical protein